jgi:hypothetical protein
VWILYWRAGGKRGGGAADGPPLAARSRPVYEDSCVLLRWALGVETKLCVCVCLILRFETCFYIRDCSCVVPS